ncbi:cytochrome c oxidase assembly protein [Sporosarcina sp. Marseille-Q4063]|uniref:cytochrome c oxidase assembly protein n=1 Tax=Sporosarcina sp. Marseille-Q4063 TaxID=2810514 RepID=UPI001BB042AA|nr:cytochrome c oxidase assembly protein [Sporosarcina sp. Marseille-Q4063]QUW22934.1 cytochrome c oxidase assembly protein [Sporosarcina sp. Marseille-Q4063]
MHDTLDNHFFFTDIFFGIPALLAIGLYIGAVLVTNRQKRLRKWPWLRTIFFVAGVLLAASALVGALSRQSHADFTAHMVGHLLLGMLAPLLIALAAPMTLLLRTLNVNFARKLSRLLKSHPIRFFSHPIVASILNIGGLWLLYTTDLYSVMHTNLLLHIVVHIHVFAAGYLFTISLLYIDPVFHRLSYQYRTIVFILALAGHGILSKFIYAYPPEGVPIEQARIGAMLMYYGGDAVDLLLIFILFRHWYQSVRPSRDMVVNIEGI